MCRLCSKHLMEADSEWMRELIQQPAGTPIDPQELAKLRLFICLAADREVTDLIELIREARQVTGKTPRPFDQALDRESPISDHLLPTKPTRPGTAAGVVELVRRGPDLFKQLPVAYQLEALRAVVIRRNREQEEIARNVSIAAANAAAEQRRQTAHVNEARDNVPHLRTWVAGQTTDLGFPSVGVHAFIAHALDPDAEGRDHDFYELLVDQKFTLSEMQQMLAIVADRLQSRADGLQEHVDNMSPETDKEDKEYVTRKLEKAHGLLGEHAQTEFSSAGEKLFHETISNMLISVVEMEDLIADFEAQQEEEGFAEYEGREAEDEAERRARPMSDTARKGDSARGASAGSAGSRQGPSAASGTQAGGNVDSVHDTGPDEQCGQ